MLDAARRAGELARGKEVGSLDPDSETALALTRLLEILGEAASRVSPGLKTRHPEVPWRDVSDTRNRVIHHYFDVDLRIVQSIVKDDLPSLARQVEVVLEEITNQTEEGSDGGAER